MKIKKGDVVAVIAGKDKPVNGVYKTGEVLADITDNEALWNYLNDDENNDYPILASRAHQTFLKEECDGMILLCGTGVGMNVVANKCDGIRSVLPSEEGSAYFARRDEDANCIVFANWHPASVPMNICAIHWDWRYFH